MRRRALLAVLGTAVTGTAGCIGDGRLPGDDRSTADTDTATDTRTVTDTRVTDTPGDTATDTEGTPSPTEVTTERPTPPSASDAFADFDCPSFDETERTVCYHDADLADVPLVLTARPEVFDPDLSDEDVETLDFTLYNRSEWSVGFNPYDWGIERYDDGQWTHVAPMQYPEPWTHLPAGEVFTWSLPSEPRPSPDDEQRHQVNVELDPGVYAFHVNVSYESHDADDDDQPDGTTELIALFRIEQAIEA